MPARQPAGRRRYKNHIYQMDRNLGSICLAIPGNPHWYFGNRHWPSVWALGRTSPGKILRERPYPPDAVKRRGWRHFVLKIPLPSRVPILYVILSVLALISVVPMYFYSEQVEAINRERLITNERLLQNTVTRSLADDIAQHQESLRMMLANLSSALHVASGGDITSEHVEAPELRALLEHFVSSSGDLAYATLVNSESKGISAGRIAPDAFLQRDLVPA